MTKAATVAAFVVYGIINTVTNFDHYTNITIVDDELCIRTRTPGLRQAGYFKSAYQPQTFSLSKNSTSKWKTISGKSLIPRTHNSIRAYQQYTREAEKQGKEIYGTISPIYQFLAENVTQSCGVPFDDLRVAFIDIEVGSAGGFAEPDVAWQPVISITVEIWRHYYVFGCGDYTPTDDTTTYFKCDDELHLLYEFLKWWSADYPDVISGWNTHTYDINYIVNRISKLQEEQGFPLSAKTLSPWRKISNRIATAHGRDLIIPDIAGIALLDYLELYRKFMLVQRESYRLDAIAELELGERKVSYDEYGSLQKLMETSFQTFIDYNIQDVRLVRKLNDKFHHIDLCTHLAYGSRVNFLDTLKQVRLWDAMMYYELYQDKIAVPSKSVNVKDTKYDGAYVKDPIVGQHEWIVSFDVNSLYPSIMRQWNISPDRHLPVEFLEERLQDIEVLAGPAVDFTKEDCTPRSWLKSVSAQDAPVVAWALRLLLEYLKETSVDRMLADLEQYDDPFPWLRVLSVGISPNKQAFSTESDGFLSKILARLYKERVEAKKKETAAKKELERVKKEIAKRQLISRGEQSDATCL